MCCSSGTASTTSACEIRIWCRPTNPRVPYDYFHVNSVQPDPDGNLIVSARDTWTVYKINGSSGSVMWKLGGKHSSFRMGRGTRTAYQHDALMHSGGLLTIFDDGATPKVHSQSRAVLERINVRRRTATLVHEYDHRPKLLAGFEARFNDSPTGTRSSAGRRSLLHRIRPARQADAGWQEVSARRFPSPRARARRLRASDHSGRARVSDSGQPAGHAAHSDLVSRPLARAAPGAIDASGSQRRSHGADRPRLGRPRRELLSEDPVPPSDCSDWRRGPIS